jgi:nitrogen fixation-related uncharacterized protein
MHAIAYIIAGSILLLPAVGLFALKWAVRQGEFAHPDRSALLPFSEEEPVGEPTDVILNRPVDRASAALKS